MKKHFKNIRQKHTHCVRINTLKTLDTYKDYVKLKTYTLYMKMCMKKHFKNLRHV